MLGTRILRMSGANATIVQDETVRLSPSRTDRQGQGAGREVRIFRETSPPT